MSYLSLGLRKLRHPVNRVFTSHGVMIPPSLNSNTVQPTEFIGITGLGASSAAAAPQIRKEFPETWIFAVNIT